MRLGRSWARVSLLAAVCSHVGLPAEAHAQGWTEAARLAPESATPGYYGSAVAIGDSDVMVGAPSEPTIGEASGSVYVYSRDDWSQVQRIIPSDATKYDDFGFSVDMSRDRAIISCSLIDQSKVYFFTRSNGSWVEQQIVHAPDLAATGAFGHSVVIDGDLALVAAPKEDTDTGRIHVYELTAGVWTETTSFAASDGVPGDFFGIDLAFDGDTAVVGLPTNGDHPEREAAYVFVRDNGSWTEQAQLIAPAQSGPTALHFGSSVSISGDTIIVSDPASGTDARGGRAVVYTRQAGAWKVQQELVVPEEEIFGATVHVEGDLAWASAQTGEQRSVYLFQRSEGRWKQAERLLPSAQDGRFGDRMDARDGTAVVGAYSDTEVGAAYVFRNESLVTPASEGRDAGTSEATDGGLDEMSTAGAGIDKPVADKKAGGCSLGREQSHASLVLLGTAVLAMLGRRRRRMPQRA